MSLELSNGWPNYSLPFSSLTTFTPLHLAFYPQGVEYADCFQCGSINPLPQKCSVLGMTIWLEAPFLELWECGVLLYCHYSLVHVDVEGVVLVRVPSMKQIDLLRKKNCIQWDFIKNKTLMKLQKKGKYGYTMNMIP